MPANLGDFLFTGAKAMVEGKLQELEENEKEWEKDCVKMFYDDIIALGLVEIKSDKKE